MPRRPKKEITYTRKALKAHEKVLRLESELRAAKEELKIAYKEQLKEEKLAASRKRKEDQVKLLKAIEESGKSTEEIMELLKN